MITLRTDISSDAIDYLSETIDHLFGKTGELVKDFALEYRSSQHELAKAISDALVGHDTLLAEAGTGVGKSLAYLIPGIILSVDAKRPFLVSTHTIALQEQIVHKDLPLCRKIFEKVPYLKKYANFKSSLLVGRANYLCRTRLSYAIANKVDMFQSQQNEELERIAEWSVHTKTGLIEELSPRPSAEVWSWVNADSSSCSTKKCGQEDFYPQAKAKMRQANVLILNHSLLFSLLNAGMAPAEDADGILFPEDFLVLDEGHTVPEIASKHFGFSISSYGLNRSLKMLYNPKTQKGLLKKVGDSTLFHTITNTLEAANNFFHDVTQRHLSDKKILRLREANWADPRYLEPFRDLINQLGVCANKADENKKEEIKDHRDRILALYNGILESIDLERDDHVYWLEKSGKSGQIIQIQCAPIDIAQALKKHLFDKVGSKVLTSATLSIGNSMKPFAQKAGLRRPAVSLQASPFDYEKNVQIYISTDVPEPTYKTRNTYLEYLSRVIVTASSHNDGGTLVLFTNYQDLYQVGRSIESELSENGRQLYMQGDMGNRSNLLDAFRKDGQGVLFGTDSFWTGVDVQGAALSQVIVTRLPFPNPSHPLAEAQAEWLQKQGRIPFSEMSLPEAVVKFRQGIGRLIRSHQDSGRLTLLDSRILNRSYGKHFITALPKKQFHRFDLQSLEQTFAPTRP